MRFSPELRGIENVVFVMFDSGNIVVTGGKSEQDLQTAYRKVVTYFEDYKLGDEIYTLDEQHRLTRTSDESAKPTKRRKTPSS